MKPDIIIPTFKTPEEVSPLVCDVEGFSYGCHVIATCCPGSAAMNRNYGLKEAQTDIVIMIDDDTAGYYDGWWEQMIRPLEEDPDIVMVSARLLKVDGSAGHMMFLGNISADYLTEVPRCATACIAFRNDGLRFDEKFEGSGFEDDDFCAQQFKKYPNAKTVINNRCRIIHLNEQKNQCGAIWEKNKAYFDKKWLTIGGNTIRVPRGEAAYHSEYNEDQWLNDNVFMGQRRGVFFECGALDGITHSNTVFYEQALGWTGLCVEANPAEYLELKNNRKCLVEHAALWDRDGGTVQFSKFSGGLRGWSGVPATMGKQHLERIKKNIPNAMAETIDVPAITLKALLLKHGLKKIDLFSLDIEGAEYTVLQNFPFSEFDIRICVIENNFNNHPIDELMNKNGYKKIATLGVSIVYQREFTLSSGYIEAGIPKYSANIYTPEYKEKRLKELLTVDRVPLPPTVKNDDHNHVAGLIDMIKELFPENAKVAEIGTGAAVSTEVFALLCGEVVTTDLPAAELWRLAAKDVFARYTNIKHFTMDSVKLASIMADQSFDVVYIDAGHEYADLKRDIPAWLPKVRPGGLLCGHDYVDRPACGFGIIQAVNEIFGKPDKVFKDTSWAVRIPREGGYR